MNLNELPDDLPIPIDDGATDHLVGVKFPNLSLRETSGNTNNLAEITGKVVLYVYPMTGHPDTPLPNGWNAIPGARGCTPQSCSFRDHYVEFKELNVKVFGLSVQSTDFQIEAKERLHLPFDILSDESLLLKSSLNIPTFEFAEMELYKRVTLIIEDGVIGKVFYPIFPPNENAEQVLNWLQSNI